MTTPESEGIQASLPTLAGEIFLAVRADTTPLEKGVVEGSRQAVTQAKTELDKLPTALAKVGDEGGTSFNKNFNDKALSTPLPNANIDAYVARMAREAEEKAATANPIGKGLQRGVSTSLPDIASDMTNTLEQAGEDAGTKGGTKGGTAFGNTFKNLSHTALREVSDDLANALGIWPDLLDPFTNAIEDVLDKLKIDLPGSAKTGGAEMTGELTAAGDDSATALDTTLTAAGTTAAEGFGETFSTTLPAATEPAGAAAAAELDTTLTAAGTTAAEGFAETFDTTMPAAVAPAGVAAGAELTTELTAAGATAGTGFGGAFAATVPEAMAGAGAAAGAGFLAAFAGALGPLAAILGSIAGGNWIANQIDGGHRSTWDIPFINPDQPPPPPAAPPPGTPPITSPEPPPGYRRRTDDPNRYEPIPGYDFNAPPPPPGSVGQGVPVPPTGEEPWWPSFKLPEPKPPKEPKEPKEPADHGGGGSGTHPASATTTWPGDAAFLANIPAGHYGRWLGDDLLKGLGDCSSAIEDLVDILDKRPTAGASMTTANEGAWLTAHGFLPTDVPMPGTFQVGFDAAHTQATLPGGTHFNWGNEGDAQHGGVGGTGAWDPAFTQHFYRPVSQRGPVSERGTIPDGTPGQPVSVKEVTPPKEKPDTNTENFGKAIVKGIFQELGFPDVFGKPFTEWGIWKALMGVGGYAVQTAENLDVHKGSQADAFFSGIRQSLGLPSAMDAGGGPQAGPAGASSDVTSWMAALPDGGPPGPRGPAPGPPLGSHDDHRHYDITQNNLAPQPYPVPVMSGVPGHP